MWTSGLTPLFIFSNFGSNNFQTVIDSKNAQNQLRTLGKMHVSRKFQLNQSNNKKNFKQNIRKLRFSFLLFLKFSLFSVSFDRSFSASECSFLCFDFRCPHKDLVEIFLLVAPTGSLLIC